jgi:hypothetical protein
VAHGDVGDVAVAVREQTLRATERDMMTARRGLLNPCGVGHFCSSVHRPLFPSRPSEIMSEPFDVIPYDDIKGDWIKLGSGSFGNVYKGALAWSFCCFMITQRLSQALTLASTLQSKRFLILPHTMFRNTLR